MSQAEWLYYPASVQWFSGVYLGGRRLVSPQSPETGYGCQCGRLCEEWGALYPPLPPDLEWPQVPCERCPQDPLPHPERLAFRVTGYFASATTAWRLSTLMPPRPPWANYTRPGWPPKPPVPELPEQLLSQAFCFVILEDDAEPQPEGQDLDTLLSKAFVAVSLEEDSGPVQTIDLDQLIARAFVAVIVEEEDE